MMKKDEFWKMINYERIQADYMVDQQVAWLKEATMEELRKVFLQYRFFTHYYGSDVGLLIYRLQYGPLKSLTSEILADELGNGEYDKCHLKMWDNFLVSIGVDNDPVFLDDAMLPENEILLDKLRYMVMNKSLPFAIGLRGMGGECLCQVYLTAMHKHFSQNPLVCAQRDTIDWEFWDVHVGPVDIEHRKAFIKAIDNYIDENPSCIDELAAGYQKGKSIWDQYWSQIYKHVNDSTVAA